jgi:hypothetical protein
MSLTNTYETHALQYLLTTATLTRPTAWYVGLYTADPTDTGSGATEISGNGYARKAVTFTVTGNEATNSGSIDFDAATGSWGTVSHIGIFDALTSGNLLFTGALTTSKGVTTGDILRLSAGELDITMD